MKHWTRITQIVFDAGDSDVVWAGVEIDDAWRSLDDGETWERSSEGIITPDIHGFIVVRDAGLRNGEPVLCATTDAGLHVSHDGARAGPCARSSPSGNTPAPSSNGPTETVSCS